MPFIILFSDGIDPLNLDSEAFASSSDGHDSSQEMRVSLTFEEAAKGVINYPFEINVKIQCIKCDGSKSELGFTVKTCPYCEGSGMDRLHKQDFSW